RSGTRRSRNPATRKIMPHLPDFLKRIEFSVLLAAMIIAGGAYGFVELTEIARQATPHEFDTRILLAFRTPGDLDNPIGPFWMEEAVRDVTSLGSASVLIFIAAATVFFLLIAGRTAG